MRLKLDENLSRHLKPRLEALQHDVSTAGEEGLLSQPDSAVALAAKNEGRMLLTLDLGFGNVLGYPPGTHPGIILFRPATFGPLAVNRFVETFVRTQSLQGLAACLVVVEPGRIRVRRPE
jgi:predicted nuclease of predicted toxin-antitoxin system